MQKRKKTNVAVEGWGSDQNENEAREPLREGQTLQGPVSQGTWSSGFMLRPLKSTANRIPIILNSNYREIEMQKKKQKKKCKKAKWLSGEALQIAVKRREAKSKGERKDINI